MFNKRYLAVLLFLIICICAISTVSAADSNATDDVIGQEADDEMAISDEDVLSDSMGSFSGLSNLIYGKSEVTLKKDYEYSDYSDLATESEDGVFIGHDLIIHGNNHVIYGSSCCIFETAADVNVEIYDVTFVNRVDGAPPINGGAIYNRGNLYLENCTFINNSAYKHGGAIYNIGYLDVNGCSFINNTILDSKCFGGAIYSNKELWVNSSYFTNNSAYYGGAIANEGYAWIQESLFGSYPEEKLIGSNKASYGTAIYNKPGKSCDVLACYFNDTQADVINGGAINNVIASYCILDVNNIAVGGVLSNCTLNQESLMSSTTLNATEFTFTATSSINTYYNSGKKLEVKVTSLPTGEKVSGVRIELIVDGTSRFITTNSDGVASFQASTLNPGKHNIIVRLYNDMFNTKEIKVPVTVKKSTLVISVSKFTTAYKSGKKWTIKVKDKSNNKPAAKQTIKLKVYTGKKSKTYTVKTNDKGVAYFAASTLNKGTHKVILSISHKGYSCKSVTSSIKINAKKLYIVGEDNKFNNCGQLILGAYDLQNEKLVSGIKLQVKIFTGKKYRTFNLVTKKSKTLGDILVLIETNAFTAGKHKVTVKITSPNYSGSETGTITIPKSAKNYKSFTYVITNGKGKYV